MFLPQFQQTFLEKPSSVVFLRSPGEDDGDNGDGWGWAATTTTIEYVTEFSPLPEDRKHKMVRTSHMHASVSMGANRGAGEEHRNGFMNVSVAGFRIELVRKVSD